MSDIDLQSVATREQINNLMNGKGVRIKIDPENSVICRDPESFFVASIKRMLVLDNPINPKVSYKKSVIIDKGKDLADDDYKAFFGENNDRKKFKYAMINSIRGFYGISMDQLRVIRKPEAERTGEEKQKIAELAVKPEDVNVLFDKCSRVIGGEELEKVLENEPKEANNNKPQKNPEPINKTLRKQITEMAKSGENSYKIRIDDDEGSKSYIFSDPKTIFKKYVADLYTQANGINIKYSNENGEEIKFTINDKITLNKDDYNKLFDGTDEDRTKEGNTAEDKAAKKRRTLVKKTTARAICDFYGIEMNKLVEIVEKENKRILNANKTDPSKKVQELTEDEQAIFNLFNDCKSIVVGEKTLTEIQEKKDTKEYSRIEEMTWTNEVKKKAMKNVSKDPSRTNLDYKQISFEELDSRLKDLTGRTFDQIIKDIANFVSNNDKNEKLRLNDALFGTGAFNPDKKKVKRKLRATVWFKKLFTKENTEYPLNENDPEGKAPSVLKPNERKSYIVDMARGTFDACLRRMIHLAPNVFDNENIGIKLKEEEGHFARNLKKIRFFSDRWIRESFDLAKGTRGDTSFWSPKQTKKSFFQKIASAYRKTPELQKLLHEDTIEIGIDQNKKYTITETSGGKRIRPDLTYDKDAKEISIIDEHNNIIESKLKEVSLIELQKQNKKLQEQLQEANKANGDKDNQITGLNKGTKALQKQNQDLQGQLDTAKNEKDQAVKDAVAQANATAKADKDSALKAKDQEIEELKRKRSEAEVNREKDEKITKLEDEGRALQKQNQDLQSQLDTAKNEKDQAVADAVAQANATAKADKDDALKVKDQEIEAVQQQNREKDEQIAQLQNEKQTLKTQADTAEAIKQELDGLRNGKANLDAQNNKMSEILSKCKKEDGKIEINGENLDNLLECLEAVGVVVQQQTGAAQQGQVLGNN